MKTELQKCQIKNFKNFMNQISVMNLRENQILAGASMGYVVGGDKKVQHTGDCTTCSKCSKALPGTDAVRDFPIVGTLITGAVALWCWVNSKLQ